MTADQILGWAMTILDTLGVRNVISVVLFITAAAMVWGMFRNRGD